MRKSLPLTMALLLGVTAPVHGQSSASANATVSASVSLAPLSLTSTGATDFGTVSSSDIVNATGSSYLNPAAPGTGQSTALFTATGEKNTNVVVTCAPASTLAMSTDATKTISYTGYVANSSASTGQSTATLLCAGGVSVPVTLNASGNQYFWLGGQLGVGSTSPPPAGTYSGSYTLSVAY